MILSTFEIYRQSDLMRLLSLSLSLCLYLSLLHHPLIMTVCLCMTACRLSFFLSFFLSWPVFSSLFSSSPPSSFSFPLSSKTIKVRIIDDEEYEKNKSFFLEIGDPQLVETNEKRGGGRGLSLQRRPHIQYMHTHTLNTSPLDHHRDQLQAKLRHRQPCGAVPLCACLRVCLCVCTSCMHYSNPPPVVLFLQEDDNSQGSQSRGIR